jgi:hypothetical protein
LRTRRANGFAGNGYSRESNTAANHAAPRNV